MNSAIWHVRLLYSGNVEIRLGILLTVHFSEFRETFSWIKHQNIPWMTNKKEEEVARNEGHYWPNVKYNGSIIGYIKCGFNNVYINDYKRIIRFPENVAFIYDTFTLSEFRGCRVASYLINETCTFLKKHGFTKVMCHIPDWNTASEKAYSNVGFTKVSKIRWLKILGFKILTANPAHL
jgi:ribosomal protein S18 acetylase RimI-like enzyme